MTGARRDLTSTVLGNDWRTLVPPADDVWTPSRSVSVCIPSRDPGPGLARTLRCLDEQTYPHSLLEIIVCDDGSESPIAAPPGLDIAAEVVRQERTDGFGAGRARNTAAHAASGEILVFLDADVIPEPHVIEAYARWFDRSDLVVPMGLCRFVEVDAIADDELIEIVAAGAMAERFEGHDIDDQSWRERHFERLEDLRVESADAFRVTIGATIAVSADQFRDIGGFREVGVRGVEDTEFGYRLHRNGAILVLDRDASHWHQGRRNLSTERRASIDEARAPYLEALLPVRGFRREEPDAPSPIEVVPVLRAFVRAGDAAARATSMAYLDEHADRDLSVDARTEPDRAFDPAAAHFLVDPGVAVTEETVRRVRQLLHSSKAGVLRVLVERPGDDPAPPLEAIVVTTRAWRRAAQICPNGSLNDLIAEAQRVFGVWWAAGVEIGLEVIGIEAQSAEPGRVDPRSRWRRIRGRVRRRRRQAANWCFDAAVDLLKRWS